MISVTSTGDSNKTKAALEKILKDNILASLDRYGQMGVDALSQATPVDTRLSAGSWYYKISSDHKGPRIEWRNRNTTDGAPVVILIQYGHATRTGGYVQGRDFINPAMRPVFDKIADDVWKKVKS